MARQPAPTGCWPWRSRRCASRRFQTCPTVDGVPRPIASPPHQHRAGCRLDAGRVDIITAAVARPRPNRRAPAICNGGSKASTDKPTSRSKTICRPSWRLSGHGNPCGACNSSWMTSAASWPTPGPASPPARRLPTFRARPLTSPRSSPPVIPPMPWSEPSCSICWRRMMPIRSSAHGRSSVRRRPARTTWPRSSGSRRRPGADGGAEGQDRAAGDPDRADAGAAAGGRARRAAAASRPAPTAPSAESPALHSSAQRGKRQRWRR